VIIVGKQQASATTTFLPSQPCLSLCVLLRCFLAHLQHYIRRKSSDITQASTDARQTVTQLRRHGGSDENQAGDTLSSLQRSCLNATSVAGRETPAALVASLERESSEQNYIRNFSTVIFWQENPG